MTLVGEGGGKDAEAMGRYGMPKKKSRYDETGRFPRETGTSTG